MLKKTDNTDRRQQWDFSSWLPAAGAHDRRKGATIHLQQRGTMLHTSYLHNFPEQVGARAHPKSKGKPTGETGPFMGFCGKPQTNCRRVAWSSHSLASPRHSSVLILLVLVQTQPAMSTGLHTLLHPNSRRASFQCTYDEKEFGIDNILGSSPT